MTEISELRSWITLAEEDFGAAQALLRLKKPYLSAACFHAQQCAEKYFKALLVLREIDFPKTHDLLALDTLCNQNGIFTGFPQEPLVELSRFAVQARYPGSQPTLEDARESLRTAGSVRAVARTMLGEGKT